MATTTSIIGSKTTTSATTTTPAPKQKESPSIFQRIQWAWGRLFGSEKSSVEPETQDEEEEVEHVEEDEFQKGPVVVADEPEMEYMMEDFTAESLATTPPTANTSTSPMHASTKENIMNNDKAESKNEGMKFDNAVVNLSETMLPTVSARGNVSDDQTKPDEFGIVLNSSTINSTYYHIVGDSIEAPQNFSV